MKVTSRLLMCGALLMLCSSFAPQEAKAQSNAVSPLVDDPSPKPVQKPSEAKPMDTNCYTNENKFWQAPCLPAAFLPRVHKPAEAEGTEVAEAMEAALAEVTWVASAAAIT